MTISLAFNFITEAHLERVQKLFQTVGCERVYVCSRTPKSIMPDVKVVAGYGLEFGEVIKEIILDCKTKLLALLLKPVNLELNSEFQNWLLNCEKDSAIWNYSAHRVSSKAEPQPLSQPCIDYQPGSVRDDFEFGPLVFINVPKAKELILKYPQLFPDDATALYGLRLAASLEALPKRNQLESYTSMPIEDQDFHASHFAYASAAGAGNQKALERTFTEYSKLAGFFLPARAKQVNFKEGSFPYEASIIIPVRNRAGKVEHAVKSALSQKTNFPFNVIVVDNHSTDGTTATLAKIASEDSKLVHVTPEAKDLGIGGCWSLAINHAACGRFSVQLDSDDIYSAESVLQRIVDEFYASNAAAVVGSYLLVDRDLNEIPPGAIEHREWTDSNGHNNAIRINGFGAPRAYFTPVIRKVGFPNVSYGEDYSAMLGISRDYKIGRIYEHLYLCRRWEGNSDAAPSIEKMNGFNTYKDSVRTKEIECRKAIA